PALAAIDGRNRTLITGQDHMGVVAGIDPELMVVVAAGRAAERIEAGAAIGGLVDGGVDRVERVFILGVYRDRLEVPAAIPDAVLVVHQFPGRAGVIGAVQSACFGAGIHHGVDAVRLGRGNGDTD